MSRKVSSQGFSAVEAIVAILIAAIIGVTGWLVWWHHPKKTTISNSSTTTQTGKQSPRTQTTDPYAGWKTYRLENGLSFKYPAGWSTAGDSDPAGIEVNSPASDGYYFTVQLSLGSNTDVNVNFLGNAPGTTIAKLGASVNGTPLYLVAQSDANANANVTGLGLATTPGSTTTSFGILDNNGHGTKNITMSANLVPAGSRPGINNPYGLQTYEAQASYSTVVNIFKSISY